MVQTKHRVQSLKEDVLHNIHALTDKINDQSHELFGQGAKPLLAFELEFTGVVDEQSPNQLDFGDGDEALHHQKKLFPHSPYIQKTLKEVSVEGATGLTMQGDKAQQLEIVAHHLRPSRQLKRFSDHYSNAFSRQSYVTTSPSALSPVAVARTLEILPKLIRQEAHKYGLKDVDFRTVTMKGERDQPNALQMNINLIGEDGTNLFDDGTGHASKLHLCFIKESLEFDREAIAFFAPSENAFERFKVFCGPQQHSLSTKREDFKMGTHMIRGQQYNTSREDDDRSYKNHDKGGVRTEHRLPSPECVTIQPAIQPYLYVESYLIKLSNALDSYKKMKDAGTLDQIDEKSLLNISYSLPHDFKQAKEQLKNSEYLDTISRDYKNQLLNSIQPSQENYIS